AARTHDDVLDPVEVHRDRRDVAREPATLAVRGHLDLLADVGAEEVEDVAAALAFDDVRAVAGIPLEPVVALAQEPLVGALVAVDEVVSGAAQEEVRAVAAAEEVAARATVLGERRQ